MRRFRRSRCSGFGDHDGRNAHIYVVESDIALTLDGLRAYYDTYVEPPVAEARSTVSRTTNNQDDVWHYGEQQNLTYCVSTAFDSSGRTDYQRAVTAMNKAAADWKAATGSVVKFIYRPGDDGNCTDSNTNVVIAVRPWQNLGHNALGFLPSQRRGTIWVDVASIDGDAQVSNKRLDGVLRHELGHVLGLKHEHVRAPNSGCALEGGDWADLTTYDRDSVMHYIQCGGNPNSSYIITAKDAEGVHELYGPTPARPLAVVTPTGCALGLPRFTLTWFSIHGVAASTFQAEIWRGSQWEMLSDGPAVSTTYTGASGRTDYLSVRACNFFGCGSFSEAIPLSQTCF